MVIPFIWFLFNTSIFFVFWSAKEHSVPKLLKELPKNQLEAHSFIYFMETVWVENQLPSRSLG